MHAIVQQPPPPVHEAKPTDGRGSSQAPDPAVVPRALLALPVLLSLALGLWDIERDGSMWRDESVTYRLAQQPISETWPLLRQIDAVHGLYYVFMHVVFAGAGAGLTTLRLPSVLAAAIAAAGVTAIASRLRGRRAGALAGAVYAALPVTQQYAQEGRSYAMVSALVVWATYGLVAALDGNSRIAWIPYAGLLALAGWLNLFALLALPAHGLSVRFSRADPRSRRRWAAAAAAVAGSLVPLAVVARDQADRQLGWLSHPGPMTWAHFCSVAAAGGLCAWYTRRARSLCGRTDLHTVALPLLVAPPAVLLALSIVRPWYLERYVLYATAGLALLAGSAADRYLADRTTVRTPARWRTTAPAFLVVAAALAALVPWSIATHGPHSRKDDVLAIARAVEAARQPGDGVLFMPSRRREWLLSSPAVYDRLDDLAQARTPAQSRTLAGTELPPPAIRRRMLALTRIVALTDPPGQPLDPYPQEAVKRQALDTYFRICSRRQALGARITVYARPGHC